MLERYTWKHDSILNYLLKTVKDSPTEDTDLYANFHGASTIPTDAVITIQRPDIVAVPCVLIMTLKTQQLLTF